MTPIKLLLLVAILVHVGSSFPMERRGGGGGGGGGGVGPAGREKVQYASWDDVNVLAHGLLQLGHGLKDHVDKTKGQMRDIAAKLKAFNGSLAELNKITRRLQEEGDALRERSKTTLLGHRGEENQSQSQDQVSSKPNASDVERQLQALEEDMRAERQSVKERVGSLEKKMEALLLRAAGVGVGAGASSAGASASSASDDDSNHSTSDPNTLQWMLETQSKRIDNLVERIRLQQDKLDKQNLRLQALQTEVKQRRLKSVVVTRRAEEVSMDEPLEHDPSGPSNELPSDCHELFLRGEKQSGVYTIQPQNTKPFDVYCEMTSERGWTVIQKREDGSLDFNKLWNDYKNGFGGLKGEFWLGLENMAAISKQAPYMLQIELSDWRGETQSLRYTFQLDGEESNYALHLQPTSPEAEGQLESALTTGPEGLPFSTADRDHDQKEDANCAAQLSGGWWFSSCGHSNLNGRYQSGPTLTQRHHRKQVVFWKTWHGRYYPLKTTTMRIAPIIKS